MEDLCVSSVLKTLWHQSLMEMEGEEQEEDEEEEYGWLASRAVARSVSTRMETLLSSSLPWLPQSVKRRMRMAQEGVRAAMGMG